MKEYNTNRSTVHTRCPRENFGEISRRVCSFGRNPKRDLASRVFRIGGFEWNAKSEKGFITTKTRDVMLL